MKILFRNVDSFDSHENERLWSLLQQSYNLSFEEFLKKQETLDKYALYYTNDKQLVGFTGIRDHFFRLDKRKYRAVYFGQTVIDRNFRGKSLIQNTVIRLLLRHFFGFKRSKLIIWNDSISYRPYLVMAKNLKSYYPNMAATSKAEHEHLRIRDLLGEHYYHSDYSPNTGTVKKFKSTLEEKELVLSEKDLSEPYIHYYVSKNPDFVHGHGLITFCPANFSNLFFYLKKKVTKHA